MSKPIAKNGSAASAADFGKKPSLAWLPVAKLQVDHAYQRSLESARSQALVKRIAAQFRWMACQAILACPAKGGGWLVLDGQHRVEAARQIGIPELPAVVVEAGSTAERAMAFVRANLDRVSINAFALFHAKVTAEDAMALATKRVCDSCAIIIPRYPIPSDKLKPGQTLALGILNRITADFGEDLAVQLLKPIARLCADREGFLRSSLLHAAWRLASVAANRRDTIRAIAAALDTCGMGRFYDKIARRRAARGEKELEATINELKAQIGLTRAAVPSADRKRLMAGR